LVVDRHSGMILVHATHHAFLASHFEVWRDQLFDSRNVQGVSDQGTSFFSLE
jgi:hypothetical protein